LAGRRGFAGRDGFLELPLGMLLAQRDRSYERTNKQKHLALLTRSVTP
jgi:hypothetical protein